MCFATQMERILTKHCAICDEILMEENNHREHVIPQALGGHYPIYNFLCKACNNKTGADAKALQQLAVLVGAPYMPSNTHANLAKSSAAGCVGECCK